MSDEYIIDDYMKSETQLRSMLETFAKQNPEVNIDIIMPQERYMKEFLEWLIVNKN